MEGFIHNIISYIESSKYILLYIATIFEGPIVMVTSGFMYKVGLFQLVPMYFILVFGDFTADISWYLLGRFGTRKTIFKYGRFIHLTPEILERVEGYFKKFHQKILIISKLTMGFGFAVVILITAGIFKIPFKNYVILNLIGGFIWTAMLITIGYFLGNIYAIIPESFKIIFIISFLALFIFAIKYISNYLKKKELNI